MNFPRMSFSKRLLITLAILALIILIALFIIDTKKVAKALEETTITTTTTTTIPDTTTTTITTTTSSITTTTTTILDTSTTTTTTTELPPSTTTTESPITTLPEEPEESEEPVTEISEPMPPSLPLPPPLSVRKFQKNISIDKRAAHSCEAEIFRVDISARSFASGRIILRKDAASSYEVEIGSLPEGIDILFSKNKGYFSRVGTSETALDLEITNETDSQKGNFSIPIIYTKKDTNNSSVICQINVINF